MAKLSQCSYLCCIYAQIHQPVHAHMLVTAEKRLLTGCTDGRKKHVVNTLQSWSPVNTGGRFNKRLIRVNIMTEMFPPEPPKVVVLHNWL